MELPAAALAVDPLALLLGDPEAAAGLARYGLPTDAEVVGQLRRLGERAGDPHAGATFLVALLPLLAEAPDPATALRHLEFWSSHLPTPATTLAALRGHPRLLADLLHLLSTGSYLTVTLAREPGLYALLAEPVCLRTAEAYRAEIARAMGRAASPETRRAVLRRIRRRETLILAWLELTGRAAPRETTAAFSALADALVAAAVAIARDEFAERHPALPPPPPIAVIAMGKLGGRELNYSSDVDLLLVAQGPLSPAQERAAQRWSERFLAVLAEPTDEGQLFRVDLRLRPEGRFGALVRSLDSCRAYFDRWVETWERQALLKARFVAGDAAVGERFVALAQEVAFARGQSPEVRDEVRAMRMAVERRVEAAGESETNVKEGRGTLRDVEFTVQLLQLLFGGERPDLRAANTWDAIERLAARGLLLPDEAAALRAGYDFFRTLEHRLQLAENRPVRVLPAEPRALTSLARSMGLASAEALLARYRDHAQRIRAVADEIYARLGFAGEGDRLAGLILALDSATAAERVARLLAEAGFREPDAAVTVLRRLASGTPEAPLPAGTRRTFAELAPYLVDACAASPDPDSALRGFERLADAKGLHRTFYRAYQEKPEALRALCRILGGAPALHPDVVRQPELLDAALTPDALESAATIERLRSDLALRLVAARSLERRVEGLRRFRRRELVRLAARDLLTEPPVEVLLGEWSAVAEVCLECALDLAHREAQRAGEFPLADVSGFAVVALGRLGGRELQFASDLDLVYLCDPAAGAPFAAYEALARRFHEIVQAVTPAGPLFEVDLRLRPEGRRGAFVTHVATCRDYFRQRAEPWERLAWVRARPVVGDRPLAGRLLAEIQPLLFVPEPPDSWRAEIAHLRRRMERERCRPEERTRHLKLGPGGMTDVEFAVQWMQLRLGHAVPAVRVPGTFRALAALRESGRVDAAQVDRLLAAYRFLVRLRQRLALRGDAEAVPAEPGEQRCLARAMGMADGNELLARLAEVQRGVRAVYAAWVGSDAPSADDSRP